MTANYIEEKDIIEEENKLYNTEKENIYPKFYNSHKLKIIQKEKEQLNNSILFNKSSSLNVSGGTKKIEKIMIYYYHVYPRLIQEKRTQFQMIKIKEI